MSLNMLLLQLCKTLLLMQISVVWENRLYFVNVPRSADSFFLDMVQVAVQCAVGLTVAHQACKGWE